MAFGPFGFKRSSENPNPGAHVPYVDMMAKGFARKKENFKCMNCGMFVIGNGYTNHCPRCLWSLHVDINPGDRQNKCGGMMEPISTLYDKTGFIIVHRCTECLEERNVFGAPNDNTELMTELSSTEQFMS